ncbi:MAG TPA: DUF92 domain-containing protein [Acidobacteriaceae bacterium]|nr:DUF92 domain-containing protein [Acidobacteriaceae bacterium]
MAWQEQRYGAPKMTVRDREQQNRWQSWLVLAAVVPWCAIASLRYVITASGAGSNSRIWSRETTVALAISLILALLVFLARAATPLAAVTGGVLSAALTLGRFPWYRTALPALLALFVLTFAATRFGSAKKQELGVAENKRGRNAAQVAANLGAAGLGAAFALSQPNHRMFYAVAVAGALAEATADTLSSEIGEVLGGPPFLLTTLQHVTPGTDGAISLAGTAAGITGAILIVLVAASTLGLSLVEALAAGAGAVGGLFFDSLLGATIEPRGWLNNDAVNFLSTLAAAGIALVLAGR